MSIDPFESSESLANWVGRQLDAKTISAVANWRMLEYWLQVELYRSAMLGEAGPWRHLGDYEQPYYTESPRSGSKYKTKWVDLVFAEPNLMNPERIVWVELKDVGRSSDRIEANLKGIGQDLAALYQLNPTKTKELWTDPPPHVVDRGRFDEWGRYSGGITGARHLISQVVIIPRALAKDVGDERIVDIWLRAFEARVNGPQITQDLDIHRFDGERFATFGTVSPLPDIIG
jgi:hypothetical protein